MEGSVIIVIKIKKWNMEKLKNQTCNMISLSLESLPYTTPQRSPPPLKSPTASLDSRLHFSHAVICRCRLTVMRVSLLGVLFALSLSNQFCTAIPAITTVVPWVCYHQHRHLRSLYSYQVFGFFFFFFFKILNPARLVLV